MPWRGNGASGRKRIWLGNIARLGDFYGQTALGHRHFINRHIGTHHDGAGPLVNHYTRDFIRLDPQFFDCCHKPDDIAGIHWWHADGNRTGITSHCNSAETRRNRFGDPGGRGEIGTVQRQVKLTVGADLERHFLFDNRTIGNQPDGREIFLHIGAGAAGVKATGCYCSLRDGVNGAIGCPQRRLDQRSASQAFGVAHRRHRDIDRIARFDKGRQFGRNHHRRHVFRLQSRLIDNHTERTKHVNNRLNCVHAFIRVAAAGQTEHQAVANQLIGPHALHFGHILDSRIHRRLDCRVHRSRPSHHDRQHPYHNSRCLAHVATS